MNVSQPLSPAIPVITQWAHDQRDIRNKKYAYIQQYRLPLIEPNLTMATVIQFWLVPWNRVFQSPFHYLLPDTGDASTFSNTATLSKIT